MANAVIDIGRIETVAGECKRNSTKLGDIFTKECIEVTKKAADITNLEPIKRISERNTKIKKNAIDAIEASLREIAKIANTFAEQQKKMNS